nr:hypothetical protein [Tanacetum cinerariifolium]
MYQGRHKGLERSCTSSKSVALAGNRILVYPNSDEEDEEYCSLPPLLLCFQTPQLSATLNPVHHNNHSEVDIESMTLEEYERYALAMSIIKKIQVPTQSFTSQFFNQSQHTSNPLLDKEDSSLEEILDGLFKIRVENLRKIEHEVPNRCDDVEENIDIGDEKEEVPMKDVEMDENHDIDHSGTEEALQWSFAEDPFLVVIEPNDQSSFLLHTIPSFIPNKVEVCGVILGRSLATRKHFKSRLVGYHAKYDDGIFVIMDVAQGSRLKAWLRA